ncbi:MAG: U32 family peptidase, partial [Clostridia bacterium]|nr:U32 family peptidase [Clostridia bacterium]
GQCLMSYFIGNRSGNRGECAQPCRLPYQLGDSGKTAYPLSLRDMCLGGMIPEIFSSGVKSLKIEGRLKTPTYVYGVTKIYRKLLDDRRSASKEEIKALADLFTRGFTDGYFTHRYFAMTGEKSSENAAKVPGELIAKELKARVSRETISRKEQAEKAKIPIRGKFLLTAEKSELTLSVRNITVTAEGQIPQTAEGRPLDRESAAKNLTKFGSTGFTLSADDLVCEIGEGLWMPASALNELRRKAADLLTEKMASAEDAVCSADETKAASDAKHSSDLNIKKRVCRKTAEFLDPAVLTKMSDEEQHALSDAFDIIYVPHEWAGKIRDIFSGSKTEIAAVMPALEPSSDRIAGIIGRLSRSGIRRFMTHTIGQASQVIEAGLTADISFRGNITNSAAVKVYDDLGCGSIYASPELPSGAVSAMNLSAIVYGKIPAMTLSRCLIAQSESKKGCPRGNEGGRSGDPDSLAPHRCRCTITDRTGSVFEVFGQQNCENIIVNTHPLWMGDRMDTLKGA